MKRGELAIAISPDALLGKSKIFIARALQCKDTGDLDQYQLWASLTLELLGKSALATIHPSLIVNPMHYQSLFAASGYNLSTDVKTITAHALFEQLRHLSSSIDDKVKRFCDAIALRRNSELHSGEAPFHAMKLGAWENLYWHAAQQILEISELSLEEWLGADRARPTIAILRHAKKAAIDAALVRVERAQESFLSRSKKERKEMLAMANSKSAFHYRGLFRLSADEEWEVECPACSGKAFLAGMQYGEEVMDSLVDEENIDETVEQYFIAEEFQCPVCALHLDSQEEIGAAGLSIEHTTLESRSREYEPDYGND